MLVNRTSVGLDVHARSVVACGLDGQTGALFERRLCPDHGRDHRLDSGAAGAGRGELRGRADRVRVGPVPDRAGHLVPGRGAVEAAAPPGDRVKTDMRDARHLARLLHLGEIVGVTVPSVEQEAARDLVRAREDVRRDLTSARHRLSKLLLRQGIVYYGGALWTGPHDRWLRDQRHGSVFDAAGLGTAFDVAYDTVLATTARRDRLGAAITQMAAASPYTPVVTRLGCLRGVATLTAFGLAVEIGDWRRLTGRSIGAYLGLVPSESSSGASRRQGSITKTGNGHARRLLIEAAWHHRPPNRIGAELRRLRRRQPGHPPPRSAGQPAPAPALGLLRRPQETNGRRQHRHRPRAGRLVLVTSRSRLIEHPPHLRR